ncbi:hypothetical protein [Streptomyces sp. GSL17-111]|uniref:hypothetical protein n=1 Tax=Streptomyces sp. GSL17-111 TaxID=3121596 RepID=UPI0030F40027
MTERPPTLPADPQLRGLGLLAEALTYPGTGETVQLVTAEDGGKWFWLHEVSAAADLPHLNTTYRRLLDGDEWMTVDVSAGHTTSTNSRRGPTGPNTVRVLLSLPGTVKVLSVARKNPRAKAFDRWARHEVLAPLLAKGPSGATETGGTKDQAQSSEARPPCANAEYVDSILALAFETQAGVAAVQRQQSETMVRITEILDRVTAEPQKPPRPMLPAQRRDEAAALLERWRAQHLLSKEVWAVAAYALPIILSHGTLQASPRRIAERTGLDVAVVNRALLDLCLAGCLRPVGETSRAHHTTYRLG